MPRATSHRESASSHHNGNGLTTHHWPERARTLVTAINKEATSHPLRAAGLAAGAGFVLGGGLFTPLTARTLRAGLRVALRLALLPAMTRGLAELAERLIRDKHSYRTTAHAGGERP